MASFRLEIVHQGWLAGVDAADDLCSHGSIRLTMAGTAVTDGTEDYGISESALAMLRTLHGDRVRGDELAESMILHGCGGMLGSGCSIGVDWTTRHHAGRVRLTDVVRYDGPGRGDAVEFPHVAVDLPRAEHAEQAARFARAARVPFETTPKRVAANEFFEGEFRAFRDEYDRLLAPFRDTALPPLAT